MLALLSISGICSKAAAAQPFLSAQFCLYWLMGIALMGIYAVGWQQAIKRLPLTVAYANKAVTVVWGIIWGSVFFNEPATAGKLAGSLLVVIGVVCYAAGEGKDG
ncbi:MAG: EamA family transporter [Eubacterium sp.]|nr:EamA family transporter [Eubacterium sp.]